MTKPINNLTAEYVKSILDYDPETGELRWKWRADVRPEENTRRAGKLAGSIDHSTGYRRVWINGRQYYSHRVAWLISTGKWPKQELDHINGDTLDMKFTNLREATHAENTRNCKKQIRRVGKKKGAHQRPRGRWGASIRVNKKLIHLGCFSTEDEAHIAYSEAAKKYHGMFVRY